MHLFLIKSSPLHIRNQVSPLHLHILTHVVPTLYETEKLLVAREACAYNHFLCSVGGMSSPFINIVLVSYGTPVFFVEMDDILARL